MQLVLVSCIIRESFAACGPGGALGVVAWHASTALLRDERMLVNSAFDLSLTGAMMLWRCPQCQRDGTKRNPFARNELRSPKTEVKLRF